MIKLIITESQFTKLLAEECGISNDIVLMTDNVYNQLLGVLPNKTNEEKFDDYSLWKTNLSFDLFGTKVTCSIDCYNFTNKEYYKYYKYSNVVSDGWSLYLSKHYAIMNLIVPCILGNPVIEDVKDTIQHEVEHLYQQIEMGKQFGGQMNYTKIKDNLNSNNDLIYKTARLIYGCLKSEQDGFVNGLYAYLMALPEMFSMASLRKSGCWKLYVEMTDIFDELKDSDEFIIELKKYGIPINNVFKAINNFIRKIGRVVSKVKTDKYKIQGFRQ